MTDLDMDLVRFVLARLAEDEQASEDAILSDFETQYILAQLKARRARIANGDEHAIRTFAADYDSHADYREEWRP